MKCFFVLSVLSFLFSTNSFSQQEDVTGWKKAKDIEQQLFHLDKAAYALGEFREQQQKATLLQVVGLGLITTGAIVSTTDNGDGAVFLALAGSATLLVSWIIDRSSYKKLKEVEKELRSVSEDKSVGIP